MSKSTSTSVLALIGLLAIPAALEAQVDAGAEDAGAEGWLAWSGCWVEAGAPDSAPMTCVIPGEDGATFLVVSEDGVSDRQELRGDGVERALSAGGCEGVQAAEFSRDGARVFTRARLACDGGTERSTRGLIAVVAPDRWIQVRALTVGEGSVSWVTSYRPAPAARVAAAGVPELEALAEQALASETARLAASVAPSVEDIIEAHGRTDAEAVRAWIAEQGAPLRLDAERLIRLADAGVSEEVIDVLVAVSYPERFEVAQEPSVGAPGPLPGYDRYGYWDRYRTPYLYDPYFYGSRRYSPYGYSSHYNYGYGTPTVVVIRPTGGDDAASSGSGRAVKGRGYTRPGSSAGAALRPSSTRGGSAVRGSSGSSGGSSGSSSKGKAKPRGNGGG